MKLSDGCITFNSLHEFKLFIQELKLLNTLKLMKPIEDNTGKILYKENLPIKPSTLNKLSEMEGQYRPLFHAKMENGVLKDIAAYNTKNILHALEMSDNRLIKLLFEGTGRNYRSYIISAFQSKRLIMIMYKMFREKPDFFDYISTFGLLTLGIILPISAHVKMIHRYAFLAGLCADIALSDTDHWKAPVEDYNTRVALAEKTVEFIHAMSLPELLPKAIHDHVYNPRDPNLSTDDMVSEIIKDSITGVEDHLAEVDESLKGRTYTETDFTDEEVANILTETLKIARFVFRVRHVYQENKDFIQPLIEKLAYNAARGYFSMQLVMPMVDRFEEYSKTARFMMRIAEIEKKCDFPPSAWAYPKPQAAQILCRKRKHDCSKILMGRDIHVVHDHEAYGWVGANLEEGKYPKCILEEGLVELSKKTLE